VNKEDNSDAFYQNLEIFTDIILSRGYASLGNFVDAYYTFVEDHQIEKSRTRSEYLLELIMIGILWRNYISRADKSPKYILSLLQKLYTLRKKYPKIKTQIDGIRGFLTYQFIARSNGYLVAGYSVQKYRNLLAWLRATGEFNEEFMRLTNWLAFFKSLTPRKSEKLLEQAVSFSGYFNDAGRSMLGGYTHNIADFTTKALNTYKYREDYVFVNRMENEYFLNMFGAEIMNRQLRESFLNTGKKAVLLPTCMRSRPESECKALWDDKEKVCVQCDVACNIGKVAKSVANENTKVYLIPHSSGFSIFLSKWANQSETGLVGVACVLNLLTGGYEMKRLNITSQCVFLDYCGCRKHWHECGIATSLNINQLDKVVANKALKGQLIPKTKYQVPSTKY
jgi:hypothetical protein